MNQIKIDVGVIQNTVLSAIRHLISAYSLEHLVNKETAVHQVAAWLTAQLRQDQVPLLSPADLARFESAITSMAAPDSVKKNYIEVIQLLKEEMYETGNQN
jgi:hypothetical protein